MDIEVDNIRAVLGHAVSKRDAVFGIDLVTSVAWYWITRATTEGVRWLDTLLAIGPGNPESQFWAYFLRGFLAVLKMDPTSGPPVLERALSTARELGQPALVSNALTMSSIAANLAGDRQAALQLLAEAETVTAELDDLQAKISVLQAQAMNGFFGGDVEAVVTAATEGIRLSRDANDLYALEMMLLNLGGATFFSGDVERARSLYAEALGIARRIDDRVAEYALLDSLGGVAAATGQARLAARLIGAAETIRTQAGASLIPVLAPLIAQAEMSSVAALGQKKYDAEVAAGKRLSREEAIQLALGEQPAAQLPAARPPNGTLGPLAKREAEVAHLLAEGLSNKQIGARLFISERTVDSHVRSILNKLGFNTRAQIAGWVASSN
jgi:DNA-binding CsgD family transcriptional regulator